ncbi:MAG: hypothetical protein ACOYVK_15740 [Bacillota bacterium]
MDNTINRIIEIDQKALSIKEKMEEMLKNNEARLKKTMVEMEKEALDAARQKGNTIYEDLVKDGEQEEQRVLEEAENACEALEHIFSTIHEGLEKSIFDQIFQK